MIFGKVSILERPSSKILVKVDPVKDISEFYKTF